MPNLTDVLDLPQAAQRLGVSRSEMYRLIDSGAVDAHKFAGRWFISVEELRRTESAPRPVGRPFSPAASWALIRLLSHLDVPDLSASRRSQLRRHLREDTSQELAGRLRRRALRRTLFAHPSALPRLLNDPAVVPSGLSALEEVGADLTVAEASVAEGYVHDRDVTRLVAAHALTQEPHSTNLVLHVVDDAAHVPTRVGVAVPAMVALDLIESGDTRTAGAGWELWAQLLAEVRGGH